MIISLHDNEHGRAIIGQVPQYLIDASNDEHAIAAAIIDQEWDDPDVQMSPAQTQELRSSITECRRLITKLEPFVKAFESVSDTRKNALVAK